MSCRLSIPLHLHFFTSQSVYFDTFFSHLFFHVLERGYVKIICSAFSGFFFYKVTFRQDQYFGLGEISSQIKYLINVTAANTCSEQTTGCAYLQRISSMKRNRRRKIMTPLSALPSISSFVWTGLPNMVLLGV